MLSEVSRIFLTAEGVSLPNQAFSSRTGDFPVEFEVVTPRVWNPAVVASTSTVFVAPAAMVPVSDTVPSTVTS